MAKVQQLPLSSVAAGSNSYGSSSRVEDLVSDEFPVGLKVLVVDDDLTCLTVLKQMLLQCRYNVTTCSQATRALALLRESKGGFDVVISDVHMPDMDGFRLLELVGLEMDLPVIMMSADTRTNIVMRGIKHGACDYLIKPVRMEELKNIWQHVVRKKFHDNKELEHSGSLDDADRNRRVSDEAEYASSINDGTDSAWKSQKKKRDVKEDDDGELDNADPSSSKKPRVVWSVELHQQFVNAVNQLGIDKAVPKRILELMNVPGLTRENVASHLQKFRLYLKRLSGVAQHHSGLPNSFVGTASNAKVGPLGRLDFQALAASGQIPPQTLAALQDELLGRPSGSLLLPAMDQSILQQTPMQGTKTVPAERGVTFGQPLLKCQSNISRQFPQSNIAVGSMSSGFPTWPSSNLGAVSSTSNPGGLNNPQNGNIMVQMLQQQQPHPVLSESQHAMNVQPSCLVVPSQSSTNFRVGDNPVLVNQNSTAVPSQSSTSCQAGNNSLSINQNAAVVSSQSSASLQAGSNSVLINQNSVTVPSHSLTSLQAVNNPSHMNQNSVIVSSQSSSSFQGGNSPILVGQNSIAVTSQPLGSFQAGNNRILVNQNSTLFRSQSSTNLKAESNPLPVNRNSGYNNGSTVADYSLLSSQPNDVALGMGQVLEEGFNNVNALNKFSIPGSISLSMSSCADSGTGWRVQTSDGNASPSNASTNLVANSCNIQISGSLSRSLPNQGQGRNLGFVGKGTCIPSRFAADDVESPSSNLSHRNTFIVDDGDIVNQDLFGFTGPF